ncbi:hypothetical protein LCGC14_2388820 [marine sediment metagenome]|uniref:Tyr recombinase domain-containing protein n=1 Tax=marine sediment metagenome TaxID=412755 RepID=A0A0F9BYW6_9ZZZZ
MASVKLLVKKHNVSKRDRKTPVYVQYNYNRDKRILINTNRKIELKFWDFENDVLRRSHPKYDTINRHIKKTKLDIETIVSNALDDGIEPNPEYILNQYYGINNGAEPNDRKGLFDYFEDYIKAKSPRVGKHTINDYHALKKHLKGYERWSRKKLEFKSINYSFYQKFMKYLSHDVVKPDGEKGLAVNTIGKTLRNLKIFLRDCARKNIIDPIDTSDFIVYQEEVENIYLTESEVNAIYELDLSKDHERERIRDLFVLGCYSGLRYSDLSSIKPANIKGDFIHLRQGKTMNHVVIPLNDIAKEIVHKYNGGIPQGIHMNDFNKMIKGIAAEAGINEEIIITQKRESVRVDTTYKKFELIASHTCRRSFCTNEYLKGTPTLFIMKISGHRTERNFLKYIKVDEQLAAQKMLEFWKTRER